MDRPAVRLAMVSRDNVEALIRECKDAVYRHMVRVCGNHEDAEDALAEAIVQAWVAADSIRDCSHFKAWLITVSTRACGHQRTQAGLHAALRVTALDSVSDSLPSLGHGPASEVEFAAAKRCVAVAINQLPDSLREVYVQREINEMPADRVAAKLGITVAAVKSRLHRARSMIRSYLDKHFA